MGCAALFPVASSVGVACSSLAGVPSLPCVVSGGSWACAGVICMASDSRFGGVCWGRASPGVVRRPLGVGRAGPSVVVCRFCVLVLVPAVMSSFPARRSLFPPLLGPWVVSCSHVVSPPVPCPYGGLPVTLGASVPPCRNVPLCCLSSPCPCPLPSRCGGGRVGGGGAAGPGLGVGGLEPLAEGFGGVGGAEALGRVPEEGLPCRLRHDGLRGGLVGVSGGCRYGAPRRCAPCASLLAFLRPRPTSPRSGAPAKWGQTTRRGERGPGGGRGPSWRSWSGGRRTWTCGGGGRGGALGERVAGTVGGGRVRATGGARGPMGPPGGGGGGHGAVVVCLAAPGGAGTAVAGTGGGGGVRAEGGKGSPVQLDQSEAFSAGVMSVRPQKNRKSFNPSPQPLQVLHEVYSKLRFHWSCVNGLGTLAHPIGSVRGHNLASMDKEMVYVTKKCVDMYNVYVSPINYKIA